MKLSTKAFIQNSLCIASIVLSSAIAPSPSQAASFADTSGSLILENFTAQSDSFLTNAVTNTNAIAAPGSTASAIGSAEALAIPNLLSQFSIAQAAGTGLNYFAIAEATSTTGLGFDNQAGGFRFDFSAVLTAIAQATEPSETATANSFVAFYIFNNQDFSKSIDAFEASLAANYPLKLALSSNFINIASIAPSKQGEGFAINGSYQRQFDKGTQLALAGFTRSEAAAVAVPEPPTLGALVILTGVVWLRRRSLRKARLQKITSRQSD